MQAKLEALTRVNDALVRDLERANDGARWATDADQQT